MFKLLYTTYLLGVCLLLALVGCTGSQTRGVAPLPTNTLPAMETTNVRSTVSFALAGGVTGTYTLSASRPISKLRHGHQEFTIDMNDGSTSIFIAFIGYHGPDSYTLSENGNGGDIHIALAQDTWDLSSRPLAQCLLTITSDTPIAYTNGDTPTAYSVIDRLKGLFSCPRLLSSNEKYPQQPIRVSNGRIDVAVLVES